MVSLEVDSVVSINLDRNINSDIIYSVIHKDSKRYNN